MSLKDSAQGEVALDGVFAMPDQVSFNRTLTYSLNITNQGNLVAENVVVVDLLPAGTSLLSLSPSQGSCLPGTPGEATQPVICNLGDLAGGATANVVIRLHVLVDTPIGTSLYNQASVSSDASDGISGNDSATNNTEVVGYKNTWFLPVMLCSQ